MSQKGSWKCIVTTQEIIKASLFQFQDASCVLRHSCTLDSTNASSHAALVGGFSSAWFGICSCVAGCQWTQKKPGIFCEVRCHKQHSASQLEPANPKDFPSMSSSPSSNSLLILQNTVLGQLGKQRAMATLSTTSLITKLIFVLQSGKAKHHLQEELLQKVSPEKWLMHSHKEKAFIPSLAVDKHTYLTPHRGSTQLSGVSEVAQTWSLALWRLWERLAAW